jgi:hypothetical protein
MPICRRVILALCTLFALGACGNGNQTVAGEDDIALDATDDVSLPDAATPEVNPYVGKCAKGPGICDDGNPCTIDDCDPAQGCVTTIKPCGDSDPCTIDRCDVKTGECVHDPDPCDDGNACTSGTCTPGSGCDFTATDCSDGDACTSDGCTPASGCLHAKLNCDDGKSCTIDTCDTTSGCVNKQPAEGKCCETDIDCDDNNVCTSEKCVAGLCASQGIYGCCKADADCDDQNACTGDKCDTGNGTCSNTPASSPGCCQTDADCNDVKPCTLDRCVANACAHEVTCCKTASDCELVATAIDACGDPTCTSAGCGVIPVTGAGCCTPNVKSSGFESGDTWTFATAPSTVGSWSVKTVVGGGKVGAEALVYSAADKAILGGGKLAIAKMAPVHLPDGTNATLTFSYQASMTANDTFRLRIVTSLGQWVVWQGAAAATAKTVSLNLSAFSGRSGAQIITLQWEVASSNLLAANGPSLSVDDIAVTSTCAPAACKKDSDCNDGLTATTESCGDGKCIYVTASEYCETSATCNDNNACTSDSCLPKTLTCNHAKVFNCCLDTSECDDKNVCTTDACNFSHQCTHSKQPGTICCNGLQDCDDANTCTLDSCPTVGLPCAHTQPDANCCMSAKNCDDGEKCTIDTCVTSQCGHKDVCCASDADCNDGDDVCTNDHCIDMFCDHTPTGAAGCCVPLIFAEDMESSIPAMWSVAASSPNVTWQWSQKKAHGGTGAIWYGNATTGNFDDAGNANSGSLQSTAIALPANNTLEFSMWVWLDTETGPPYDELTLSAMVDGQTIPLWTKHKDLDSTGSEAWKLQTWYQVHANLSAFAGKTVILTLKFDTIDGVGNSGAGVFVDDFQLTRSCAPAICNVPQDCDDKLPATSDGCAGGQCTYAY